ncbi:MULTISPECIES: lysozyme inhibitor LprI family protein [Methylomonas]|uniref:Lysozyme inhibitor LprI-like N-terminal domain-containing protein n=1 Tax=Methylomonas koyamae TaxID=702114 RepID=A0A177N697_9GAMM|nr:lysozyme inhibitor LprI family protein [Methylomonas koyamae]OAI13382.1 hypothetical protein A1355_13550 [Methylomonas koyamae]
MIGFRRRSALIAVVLSLSFNFAHAIDNPDTPDLTAEFLSRADAFEQAIYQHAQTTEQTDQAYRDYAEFLDKALNRAYSSLQKNLPEPSKQTLLRSQRLWLQFRDAELDFINGNWTIEQFGSSSAISRHGYRTALIKSRVLELLQYLKNY